MGGVNSWKECWKLVLTDANKRVGRKTHLTLNGASIGYGRCCAVFGMTGVNNHKVGDKNWQTCHFDGNLLMQYTYLSRYLLNLVSAKIYQTLTF